MLKQDKKGYKIGIISLGCPKNLVDTEVLLGLLKERGNTITGIPNEAEIIVINTCSFIDSAKEESLDSILEMAELKKAGKCFLLLVTGCLPQEYGKKLLKLIPEIDYIFGTEGFVKIPDLIDNLGEKPNPPKGQKYYLDKTGLLYDHTYPRYRTTLPHIAYIKIAEGCNHHCSYCLIPDLRGRYRSRDLDSIIKETYMLIKEGVREIYLIAQDTTAFGKDKKDNTNINMLLEKISGLSQSVWIRLLYTYPNSITKEMIDIMVKNRNIVPYLDIPIQHSHEEVLKAMNRPNNIKYIEEIIEYAREVLPDIVIRTTFMVGFPGETESVFKNMLDFINRIKFDRVGVFVYSRQKNTDSYNIKGQVAKKIRDIRYKTAMELQANISFEKNKALIGSIQEFICDYPSYGSEGIMIGRIKGQAFEIDGITYVKNSKLKAGEIYNVRIIGADYYDLLAEVI